MGIIVYTDGDTIALAHPAEIFSPSLSLSIYLDWTKKNRC